jgi:hypothetical protein
VVTMIPKKESFNSKNPAEHIPISLFSCIRKLAERIVKNRLYFY